MESKELNEILNKTRRTKDISLSVEQIKELVKDLGELESYRKVMCRPVRDLMDDLERLEKQDKMLNSMSNYTLTYKDDKGTGFVIEMWSDFEGFEDVKDWVEKIYQNDKKIERKFDEDDNKR